MVVVNEFDGGGGGIGERGVGVVVVRLYIRRRGFARDYFDVFGGVGGGVGDGNGLEFEGRVCVGGG